MLYETRFWISLGVTCSVEVVVLAVLVKGVFREKLVSWKELILVGALASLLTLPYLWFALKPYFDARYYLFIGEGIVFLVEGLLYLWLLRLKWWKAFLASVVANLVSFGAGYLLVTFI
jgi:hypothetical protein